MTAKNRFFYLSLILLIVIHPSSATTRSMISGSVLDNETMEPLEGIEVDVVLANSADAFVIVAFTDVSGLYNVSVDPGEYDVRISKLGNVNLKKTVYAEEGSNKQVDFLVGLRNTAKARPATGGGDMILWAAAIVLVAAAIYLLRKKKGRVSEQPAEELKKERPVVVASDELTLLKTERERLKHMMVVERAAFEERKINEERLKEVLSDYECSLEEIKRKISELEGA